MVGNLDEAKIGVTFRHQSAGRFSPFHVIAESVSAYGGDLVVRMSALIKPSAVVRGLTGRGDPQAVELLPGPKIDVAVLCEDRAERNPGSCRIIGATSELDSL